MSDVIQPYYWHVHWQTYFTRHGFLAMFFFSGLLTALPNVGQAATLVVKGQPHAIIILPEKLSPVAESAARVLRDHIRQMSGAELPIRTENQITGSPTQEQAWVLVGEGKLTEKLGLTSKGLRAGGILQSAKGQVVALIGTDARTPTDPYGTRYAVTTFLENKLGVRYLWPGELGKVVPRRETIAVEDFQHRFTPKLTQRQIRSMGYHDRIQQGKDRGGEQKSAPAGRQHCAQRWRPPSVLYVSQLRSPRLRQGPQSFALGLQQGNPS